MRQTSKPKKRWIDLALVVLGGALILYGVDASASQAAGAASAPVSTSCLLSGAAELAFGFLRIFTPNRW